MKTYFSIDAGHLSVSESGGLYERECDLLNLRYIPAARLFTSITNGVRRIRKGFQWGCVWRLAEFHAGSG
jgi:hypothetical protein